MKRIFAADEDTDFEDSEFSDMGFDDESEGSDNNNNNNNIEDQLNELNDAIDDLSKDEEDITEDDPEIQVDNNIENHYIAECDRCQGIFITSVIEEENQAISSIQGQCPLCNHETEQILKWIVREI